MKHFVVIIPIAFAVAGTSVSPGNEPEVENDRFVVFARNDQQGKAGRGPVLVFEYRPGRAELVKRAEMEVSDWSPDSMFDSDSFDGFIRHQVSHPGKRPAYETHFYHLDVRDWQLQQLLVSDRIHGLFVDADRAWLKTDQGIRILDRRDLTFQEDPPQFEVLRMVNDRYALIMRPGAGAKEAELFDFGTGESVAQLELPPGDNDFMPRIELRDDAGALAIFPGVADLPLNLSFAEKTWLDTELYLYDLKQGKRHAISFKTQVTPGSGVPVIYLTLDMGFADDDSLELTDGDPPRFVKVDPVTGETSDHPNPAIRPGGNVERDTDAIVELVNEKSGITMAEKHYFRHATLNPGGEFLALTPDGKTFLSGNLEKGTVRVLPNPSRSVDVSICAFSAPANVSGIREKGPNSD